MRLEAVLNFLAYTCAAAAFACVFRHVHWFFAAAAAGLFLLALYRDKKATLIIPRWLVNVLSLAVILPVLLRLQPTRMIEPLLEALVILLGLKLLETRKARDHLQIYLLSLLLLVGSSLLSISAIFLVHFILLSILLTTSLMVLTHRSQQADMTLSMEHLGKILKSSALICLLALPLTIVFFLVLPRIPHPMMHLPGYEMEARSGFSDRVTLGEVSTIQLDRSVVFRAVMEPAHEKSLYWRGIVLDEFTGTTWRRSFQVHQGQPGAPRGKEVHQVIYLEPYGGHHLFALDKPIFVRGENLRMLPGLTFSLQDIPQRKLRYTAKSVASELLPETLSHHHHYLQLPPSHAPQIRRLVDEVLANSSSHLEKMERLRHFFQAEGFTYTLSELPVSDDPLKDFLLKTKEGNCEYFASALALMLRMADIPSRVVGGYRGGIYNGAAGYYLVTQKHAHVWVEAYIPSKGWVRLDPTPSMPLETLGRFESPLSHQFRLAIDTFHFYWARFVINYDLSQQIALAEAARNILANPPFPWDRTTRQMLPFVGGFLLVLLIFGGLAFLGNRPPMEKRLVTKFSRRLAAHGYKRSPQEGLEEFVNRIQEKDLREASRVFVEELERAVYRDQQLSREQTKRLELLIRRL